MSDQPSVTFGQQSAQRKRLIASVTGEQLELCRRDYRQHLVICDKLETPASSFDIFLVEWLECERGEKRAPVETRRVSSNDDCQSRSYDRMFEGKRGWD